MWQVCSLEIYWHFRDTIFIRSFSTYIHPTQSHSRQLLYSYCCETLESHALKMILVVILILSCYGSHLLSTEMLYKKPQPCWLLFQELLPAVSNNERNQINKWDLTMCYVLITLVKLASRREVSPTSLLCVNDKCIFHLCPFFILATKY